MYMYFIWWKLKYQNKKYYNTTKLLLFLCQFDLRIVYKLLFILNNYAKNGNSVIFSQFNHAYFHLISFSSFIYQDFVIWIVFKSHKNENYIMFEARNLPDLFKWIYFLVHFFLFYYMYLLEYVHVLTCILQWCLFEIAFYVNYCTPINHDIIPKDIPNCYTNPRKGTYI